MNLPTKDFKLSSLKVLGYWMRQRAESLKTFLLNNFANSSNLVDGWILRMTVLRVWCIECSNVRRWRANVMLVWSNDGKAYWMDPTLCLHSIRAFFFQLDTQHTELHRLWSWPRLFSSYYFFFVHVVRCHIILFVSFSMLSNLKLYLFIKI